MKITISRTQNGAWIRIEDDGADAGSQKIQDRSYVFDAYKHDGSDMSGAVTMLYDVLDYMGWLGDKHDEQRVQVRVVHGSDFEHDDNVPESECEICRGAGEEQ